MLNIYSFSKNVILSPHGLQLRECPLRITPFPFQVELMRGRKTILSESAGKREFSSLFYEIEKGRQFLTPVKAIRVSNNQMFFAAYSPTRDRTVEKTVKKGGRRFCHRSGREVIFARNESVKNSSFTEFFIDFYRLIY